MPETPTAEVSGRDSYHLKASEHKPKKLGINKLLYCGSYVAIAGVYNLVIRLET